MSTPPVTEDRFQPTATDDGVASVLRTALAPRTVLAGRYRVERLIGEGGMGDVYLATHLKIDKPVAIKVLAPEQMRRPRTVGRFLQEAKAASKIRHDNVVDITDFGEAEGCAFFVMEFLDGEDLNHLLKRERRISWDRAKAIAIQLLGGLGAAHDAGVIHRDVKPHNCFISPRETNPEFLKVIDFGIAKLNDGSEEQLTRTGAIMGTAEYMSPEQGQGLELDGRSDLYSVGVILYRMLTGRVPYRGGNPMAILYQHIHAALTPPSEACPEAGLSVEVDALVARALAKEPADRFATAAEFIAALQQVDGRVRPPDPAEAEGTSKGVLVGAGLLGVVMLAAAAWFAWPMLDHGAAEPTDAPTLAAANANANANEPDPSDAARPTKPAPAVDDAPATAPPTEPSAGATEPAADSGEPAEPADAAATTDAGDTGTADDAAASTGDAADVAAAAAEDAQLPARRSARRLDAGFARVADKVGACGKQAGVFPGEKVTVEAKIATSGRVTHVEVKGAHNASGRACIVRAVERARFDPAARPQTASHRFSM